VPSILKRLLLTGIGLSILETGSGFHALISLFNTGNVIALLPSPRPKTLTAIILESGYLNSRTCLNSIYTNHGQPLLPCKKKLDAKSEPIILIQLSSMISLLRRTRIKWQKLYSKTKMLRRVLPSNQL
jgi:hypothetical protein